MSSINWEEMYKQDKEYFDICIQEVGAKDREEILKKVCANCKTKEVQE